MDTNKIYLDHEPSGRELHRLARGRVFGILRRKDNPAGLVDICNIHLTEAGVRMFYPADTVIIEIDPSRGKQDET